jgi:hypothetical protein
VADLLAFIRALTGVAGEELARRLFDVREEDIVEVLKWLRAKCPTPAVSDAELLANTRLRKLKGRIRRRYRQPAALEDALRAWYTHWEATGADPYTMVPLFTADMPAIFENQLKHVREGRYSGACWPHPLLSPLAVQCADWVLDILTLHLW